MGVRRNTRGSRCREAGRCPALPRQSLGWEQWCFMRARADTGHGERQPGGEQLQLLLSSPIPPSLLCSPAQANGAPKPPLELGGLCSCPLPTAYEGQGCVCACPPCIGIHCIPFSPCHLVLLGWQQREVICEHTRLRTPCSVLALCPIASALLAITGE